jgi:phosphoribosylanthranilate isomerase
VEAAALNPYAIDVASGVEAVAGIKDHDKLRSFIANARPSESSTIESGLPHAHAKLPR